MKKILSLLLATAIAVSGLAFLFGCAEEVRSDEVVALRVTETPTTVEYEVGDTFSAEGGKIIVVYGDGSVTEIDMNAEGVALSAVDTSEAGRKTVTVTYEEVTTSFVIYVGEPTLPDDEEGGNDDDPSGDRTVARITVLTAPTKTEYFVGDEIDYTGGVLTVTYTNRETATVPFSNRAVTFDSINNTTAGSKTVTVRYGGRRTTFSVRYLSVAGIVTFEQYGESDLEVKVAVNGYATEPEEPTRAGYTFAGWYSDSACIYPYIFSSSNVITGDTTIYSYWKDNARSYNTVNIDLNYYGTTPDSYVQTVISGEAARLIAEPTRAEFRFDGWCTDAAGTTPYTTGTAITADTTLYAKWTKTKVGSSTYTFEAEDTNLDGKTGMSNSGSPLGKDMIAQSSNLSASGGRYVTYLYNNNLSLEFYFASSEATTATIAIFIAAELDNINISQSNYRIEINGSTPDYGTLNMNNGGQFRDWINLTVTLNAGYNFIQLTTANSVNPVGNGTYAGTAPMVDCIKITTEAVLTWDANYNLPMAGNY